jgi:hypothetical protein
MDAGAYAAGNFLAVKDVIALGSVVRITGEAVVNKDTPFKKDVLEIPVELSNGEEKTYGANKTSAGKFVAAWGKETKAWVGKTIKFAVVKQNVQGQVKDVLYGEPADGTIKPETHVVK